MEEQDKKTTYYLVPANVTARFEFFEGFGWKEFTIVAITLVISGLIYFLLGLIQHNVYVDANGMILQIAEGIKADGINIIEQRVSVISPFLRLLFVIMPTFMSFLVAKKIPSTGMSIIDLLKLRKKFSAKQKQYLYVYNSADEGGR